MRYLMILPVGYYADFAFSQWDTYYRFFPSHGWEKGAEWVLLSSWGKVLEMNLNFF